MTNCAHTLKVHYIKLLAVLLKILSIKGYFVRVVSKKSVSLSIFYALMLLLCSEVVFAAQETPSYVQARYILDEINKYRKANAPRALAILERNKGAEFQLSVLEQIEWNLAVVVIASNINDMTLERKALLRLHYLHNGKERVALSPQYLMYLGHHFVKASQPLIAMRAYSCAVSYTHGKKDLIPILYSLGVASNTAGNPTLSRMIFGWLKIQVANGDNQLWLALVSEALGIAALEDNEFTLASESFRVAMDIHQETTDRRAEFNSSLNLLLSFALRRDFDHFSRLEGRVRRLSRASSNKDLQIYFESIQATASSLRDGPLPPIQVSYLKKRLSQVQSQLIHRAIVRNMKRHLGLSLVNIPDEINKTGEEQTKDKTLIRALDDAHCDATPDIDKILAVARERVEQEH